MLDLLDPSAALAAGDRLYATNSHYALVSPWQTIERRRQAEKGHRKTKLTGKQVLRYKSLVAGGMPQRAACKELGISKGQGFKILAGWYDYVL